MAGFVMIQSFTAFVSVPAAFGGAELELIGPEQDGSVESADRPPNEPRNERLFISISSSGVD
jgi:hypothetical protein